ncbi:uncharacterized protein LOC135345382 isoform X2 [Halichondria panicea]|uniref:uncharacterized protein LOC135345382 isoform X2 n=1 Tax=Halichondria panicea TaxID=6063 RepID=UPI00312BCB73
MSDSAEYKAFKDCHDSLFTCIKQSPKDVSDRLEILAPADRDYLRNDSHDDGDKARRIIDAVLLQIENNPLVFQSFISALEAAGSFTKTTVPKLHDALLIQRQNQEQCDQTTKIEESDNGGQAGEELQPISVSTSSSGFESLTASDFNTDGKFFSFQCGCGKCTILGHVTGRDKCLSSKPPQIKRITRDTACSENRISATEISYKKFMTALLDETRHIHSKFCSLLTNTITNLENQYDITKVKQYVQALLTPRESYYSPVYRRPSSEQILFRDVTSFRDLSVFLQNNFCSWFNYSLISVMREEFLFPYENDQALLRYEHLFRQYVNRRCFLFVDDFGPQPSHIQSVEITCKIDVDFQTITYDQIQQLELVFMKCWEQIIPHQVLNLKNVREGCTELVFRVPAYFKHIYSQLSPEQMQYLKENAFIEVKIGQQVILKAEDNSTKKLLKAFGQDGGDPTSAVTLLIGLDPTVDVSSIRDSDGMTLLHLACRWDWSKWGLLVTQLVETHHHNVSVVNEDGDTPLHIAARFNNRGAAEYLLEPSDANARNNVGLTAFDIADQKQHQEVLRVLVECDEIFANIPIISVPIISTHDDSQSDEPIHGTSSDSDTLPMSPSADESTSTQEDGWNSTTSASTVEGASSALSTSLTCNSVMEDVCLNTEVQSHVHDQRITSVMEDVCKKTGVRDQQLKQEISESDIILLADKSSHLDKATVKKLNDALQRQHQQCDQTPKFEESGERDWKRKLPRIISALHRGLIEESMEDDIHIQGLPDEFYISGGPTNELEDFRVRRTVDRLAADISERDVQQQSIELVPILSKTSEVSVPAVNDPSNDKDESSPLIKSPSTKSKGALRLRSLKRLIYKFILIILLFFLFLFTLGSFGSLLFGSLLYDSYSLVVGTTNVAQIHRQSVPLIGIPDNPSTFDSLSFSEPTNGTDFVPISFYTLWNCFYDDAFIDVEITETLNVNFDSPTDKSKPVTELYLLGNTTLTVDITTEIVPNYLTNSCIAFLLVFDNFNKFWNFNSNPFLVEDFYYKECIENNKSQTMNITFVKRSYYYIGVYTDIPTEATTFSLHFLRTNSRSFH